MGSHEQLTILTLAYVERATYCLMDGMAKFDYEEHEGMVEVLVLVTR